MILRTEWAPVCTDHKQVTVELRPPSTRQRGQVAPKPIYLPDTACGAAQRQALRVHLQHADLTFCAITDPIELIRAWERLKTTTRQLLQRARRDWLQALKTNITRASNASSVATTQCKRPFQPYSSTPRDRTTEQSRMHERRRRTLARYRGRTAARQRAFFARFCTRRANNAVTTLADRPHDPRPIAEQVQADWLPIFQQRRATCNPTDFLNTVTVPRRSTSANEKLTNPITETEVRTAIRQSARRKAPGPDRLSNDVFRDAEDEWVPLLTHRCRHLPGSSVLPRSFAAAHIYAIKKKDCPSPGLDFRPIALLNTDYKIHARIYANRLTLVLPTIVGDHQTRFVKDRSIHDTIRIAQQICTQTKHTSQREASVVCLDFAKAYDTLNRTFLQATLEKFGFHVDFVSKMEQLHCNTTARCIVGGGIAPRAKVVNGIRQGCPFAPMLFILAVEVLHLRFRQDTTYHGVELSLPDGSVTTISSVGYADDTTLFPSDNQSFQRARDILADYGAASGLRVNADKTTVLPLPNAPDPTDSHFRWTTPTTMIRFLGAQLCVHIDEDAVWTLTRQQITTRMALATHKTTDPLQRMELVRAIMIPKFLFVARHHWSSTATVKALQRMVEKFVWSGRFDMDIRHRGWIGSPQCYHHCGTNMPNLSAELAILSVKENTACVAPPTPSVARVRPKLRHRPTVEAARRLTQDILRAQPWVPVERQLALSIYTELTRLAAVSMRWHAESLDVDVTHHERMMQRLCVVHDEEHGRLNLQTLMAQPLNTPDLFVGSLDPLLPLLAGHTIADVVHLQQIQGAVRCTARVFSYPLANPETTIFKLFITILLASYPELALETKPDHLTIPVMLFGTPPRRPPRARSLRARLLPVEPRVHIPSDVPDPVAAAIRTITLKKTLSLPTATTADAALWCRLQLMCLTWWTPRLARAGCPHCGGQTEESHFRHWLLNCPFTKRCIQVLRRRWQAFTPSLSDADLMTAVVRLSPPPLRHWWHLIRDTDMEGPIPRIRATTTRLWQLDAFLLLRFLWQARFSDTTSPTIYERRLDQNLSTLLATTSDNCA